MRRSAIPCLLAVATAASTASAASSPSPCQVDSTVYEGWQAQQVSNDRVQLTFDRGALGEVFVTINDEGRR
jgi:hypothetical protein